MTEIKYTEVTKSVISAVRGDLNARDNWKSTGAIVAGFYGTEIALTEVKAQFIADAIMPALDKKYSQALAVELPRKGSKEYNALDQSGRDKWESQNKAKKDARAVAHTMFARVLSYAFPSEKEQVTRTLKTRFCEDLAALIKAGEKAETAEFDMVACLNHLRAALAVAAK